MSKKHTVELTIAQLHALGGAAIHFACANAEIDHLSDEEKDALVRMNALAHQLVVASGMLPTGIKDLGLSLIARAQGRRR